MWFLKLNESKENNRIKWNESSWCWLTAKGEKHNKLKAFNMACWVIEFWG